MSNERDRGQGRADGAPVAEVCSASGGLTVTAAGQTDIGRERKINQDTLGNLVQQYADRTADLGLLYAVADGMGGHVRGEVASAMAIENLFARYYAADPAGDPAQTLARTMIDTNAAVFSAGPTEGARMGTTLTVALLRGDRLYVGNIGDSRTYRIRKGQIEQLSRDHSLIGEQVRSGLLSAEEARHSNIRNVITRALGYREEVEPDTFVFPVEPGDIILLCSDGLHGLVEDDELARALAAKPLGIAISELIDLARQRGGPDNITALAVRVETPGAPVPDDGKGPAGTGAATDDGQTTQPFSVIDGPSGTPTATAATVAVVDAAGPADTASGNAAAGTAATPAAGTSGAATVTEQVRTLTEPAAAGAAPAAPAATPIPAYGPGPPSAGPAAPSPPAGARPPAAPTPAARRGPPIWLFVLVPLMLLGLAVGAIFALRAVTAGQEPTPAEPPAVGTAPLSIIPSATGTAPLSLAPATTAAPSSGAAEAASTTVPTTRVAAGGAPAEGTATGRGEAIPTTIVGTVSIQGSVLLELGRQAPWEVVLTRPGGALGTTPIARATLAIPDTPANLTSNLTLRFQLDLGNTVPDGPYTLLIRKVSNPALTLPCSEKTVPRIEPGTNSHDMPTIDCALPQQ